MGDEHRRGGQNARPEEVPESGLVGGLVDHVPEHGSCRRPSLSIDVEAGLVSALEQVPAFPQRWPGQEVQGLRAPCTVAHNSAGLSGRLRGTGATVMALMALRGLVA